MKANVLIQCFVLCLSIFLVSCQEPILSGSSEPSPSPSPEFDEPLTSVDISNLGYVLLIGSRYPIDFTYAPESATEPWTWRSDNPEIAIVDAEGFVEAVGVGTTLIRLQNSDGSIEDSLSVEVVKAVKASGGGLFSMFLTSNGMAFAMGHNEGRYATDFAQAIDPPFPAYIGRNYTDIHAGTDHSIVVSDKLLVYGFNTLGQLGIGNIVSDPSWYEPLDALPVQISGRNNTLLVLSNGSVWCTGDNSFGQLATDNFSNKFYFSGIGYPVQENARQVSAGQTHTLLVLNDGSLWSVGANAYGQRFTGDTHSNTVLSNVIGGGVKKAVAGLEASIVLMEDGEVRVAGANGAGQLGVSNETPAIVTPHIFPPEEGVEIKDFALGRWHSMKLLEDGRLYTAGSNEYGQLGDDTVGKRGEWVKVADDIESIAAGDYHSLAITKTGRLMVAGRNEEGQLGPNHHQQGFSTVSARYIQFP